MTDHEKSQIQLIIERLDSQDRERKELLDLVRDWHHTWMVPQPGHDKSLSDRTAAVVIQVESGGWLVKMIIKIGALLAALGIIAVAFKMGVNSEAGK